MQKDEPHLQMNAGEHPTKTRWILVVAFGGMLLLLILAGVDSLRSLTKLNQVSNEVAQQFARRSHALVTVVISFHTYTDEMEQFLLSDEIGSDAPGVAEVTKRGAALHAAINDYSQDCVKEELLLLQQMEKSVGAEESSFDGLLAGSMDERKQL